MYFTLKVSSLHVGFMVNSDEITENPVINALPESLLAYERENHVIEKINNLLGEGQSLDQTEQLLVLEVYKTSGTCKINEIPTKYNVKPELTKKHYNDKMTYAFSKIQKAILKKTDKNLKVTKKTLCSRLNENVLSKRHSLTGAIANPQKNKENYKKDCFSKSFFMLTSNPKMFYIDYFLYIWINMQHLENEKERLKDDSQMLEETEKIAEEIAEEIIKKNSFW